MAAMLGQRVICDCFNALFGTQYNVRLQGGGREPEYRPGAPALLIARSDYTASALHEAAHWCVAGAARRRLPDYGYPYLAPPRAGPARSQFFALERRAQAFEAVFSDAAGLEFRASADDLSLPLAQLARFEQSVRREAAALIAEGRLPGRAQRFARALRALTAGQSGWTRPNFAEKQ